MAIQITSQQRTINPAGNPYWIVASSSNVSTKYNFTYNYEIKINNQIVATKRVIPNPYNQLPEIIPLNGESDINTVIRDKFSSYLPPVSNVSGLTYSQDNYLLNEVTCREVYSPTLNQVPIATTASTSQGFVSINTYLSQDDYYKFIEGSFLLNIIGGQTTDITRLLTNRSPISQLSNYNLISFINNGYTVFTTGEFSAYDYFSDNFSNAGDEVLQWDIFTDYAQLAADGKNLTSTILVIDDWTIAGNHIKWRENTEISNLQLVIYMDVSSYNYGSGQLKFLGYSEATDTWIELAESISSTNPTTYEFEIQFTSPFNLTENFSKFGIQLKEFDVDGPTKFFVYKKNQVYRYYGDLIDATTGKNLFVIRGYKNGQLNYVDSYPIDNLDAMQRVIMTDYYKSLNINYYDINITPDTISPIVPFSLTNTIRLKNDCNSINNFEEVTLIWMNSYGEWDSYTFMKLVEQITTQKIGIRKDFNTRLSTTQTQNYTQMNRNVVQSFNIITKNISIVEYEYLYNILLTKDVYWLKDDELYSIVVSSNEIQSKPINNIYKQLQLNVRLSQKLTNN